MSEETRKEILNLLAEGKITAGEAAEMLAAVKEKGAMAETEAPAIKVEEEDTRAAETAAGPVKNGDKGRWFRVHVSQLSTGKRKVSINIPLRLVTFGLSMADKLIPETREWDRSEIKTMIDEGLTGTLVDVEDEIDDEHVRIYID